MSCVKQCWLVTGALGLALVLGCGSRPAKHDVTGKVELDGQPVATGAVTFRPKGKGQAPEGGTIQDGRYAVKVAPGKYEVLIDARKKVPLAPGEASASGEKDKLVSIVPARYEAVPLVVEVTGDGEHHLVMKTRPN